MRRSSYSPEVEHLERRLVPAGNVLVHVTHAGALVVEGDDAANGIQITQTGSLFTVTGLDAGGSPTKINGTPDGSFTHAVTGNIEVNLHGGDNMVRVGGTGGVTAALVTSGFAVTTPKGLAITTGGGKDQVVLDSTQVGGNLLIRTGAGNDSVQINNSDVTGNTFINTGSGDDTVTIDPTHFHGALAILTRGGNDHVTLQSVTVDGATFIRLGSGNDTLAIGSSFFTGGLHGRGGTPTTAPGDTYQDLGGDPFNSAGFDMKGFETIIPFNSGS